jgi:hypothetical protein
MGGTGRQSRFWLKISLGILGFLLITALAGWFTLALDPALPPQPGVAYPYTATYDLQVPDGEKLMIGNTAFIVMTAGNEAYLKLGESREKLAVGDVKTITEKRAVIKTLGITILDTNYRIDATYRGLVDNKTDFFLNIRTSQQIPQFLINQMLPKEMRARPV